MTRDKNVRYCEKQEDPKLPRSRTEGEGMLAIRLHNPLDANSRTSQCQPSRVRKSVRVRKDDRPTTHRRPQSIQTEIDSEEDDAFVDLLFPGEGRRQQSLPLHRRVSNWNASAAETQSDVQIASHRPQNGTEDPSRRSGSTSSQQETVSTARLLVHMSCPSALEPTATASTIDSRRR